jgi:hypothetical protein
VERRYAVDTLGPSPKPGVTAPSVTRSCVFCREDIRPGATVCCHCGSNLTPLQSLADQNTAIDARLAALEQAFAAHRDALGMRPSMTEDAVPLGRTAARPPVTAILRWPHMTDNIFLGVVALLAAHWMATSLPVDNRAVFRLVALAVALPFGYRFEANAHAGTAGQALAALAFGCLGTLSIGLLDALHAGRQTVPVVATDLIAIVATIALSHFAGSSVAEYLQTRKRHQAGNATAVQPASTSGGGLNPLANFAPAKIKTTAETVKALYDATVPIAASAAALWAAIGHFLS